jgi:hypothetical protein
MMASRNPQDWVNYDELMKGPYSNHLLDMIKKHNIMTDCPYCIDMLTIDEAERGICDTCRMKVEKSKVVDLTELPDDTDDESVAPVQIPISPLIITPPPPQTRQEKIFDDFLNELDDDTDGSDTTIDDDLWERLDLGLDMGMEFVVRKDTEEELGGSVLGRRKRQQVDGEQKKIIMAQHNKKRRQKDKDINKTALHGINNVDDELREYVSSIGSLSEIERATILHLQDTLIQHVNSFKLRTSPFTK